MTTISRFQFNAKLRAHIALGGSLARAWSVPGQMQLGMNNSSINSYSARRFSNVLYDMAPWAPVVLSGGIARTPGTWSQLQGSLTGDGDGSGTDGKYFRAAISSTQYGMPAGTYTVFNPSGQEIAIGAFSSLYLQTWTTAKYFTFTYTPSDSGMYLWCRRSLQNTGAGNLQIIAPGCVGNGTVDTVNGTYQHNGTSGITSGSIWHPDFATFVTGLNVQHYRWMPTLSVIGSIETDWSDRVLPTGISLVGKLATVTIPHEFIIDFSNRFGIDPWINLSPVSTPDYWTQCGALYKAQLNPNRKILPEYGNETWNYYLSGATYADVSYLQYTKHYATVSDISNPGLPVFSAPSHGRSVGDTLALFSTRENAWLGFNNTYYVAEGYQYVISAVPDANHFTLNLAATSHTLPTGVVNIQYAWTSEPGKSIAGVVPDQNHSTQQLRVWDAFDAALGSDRVIHSVASQAANTSVTTNRINVGATAARADHVHVAPYYNGLYWMATFTGGGSQITPSCWAWVAGTVYFGVYAAGSTPSSIDIARGQGAGFIGGSSMSIANNTVAPVVGTAITGLTDGTNYAAFAVFKETTTGNFWRIGTGTDPVNPSNVLSTVAAGAQNCFDTVVNQAARCRLHQIQTSNELGHKAVIAAAGSSATLITYEGGPDFISGTNCPSALQNWILVTYFPSAVHAGTFTHSLNHLARVGYRSHNHYCDIQGGGVIGALGYEYPYDLVPNQLYSSTTVDGRYAAYAAFKGVVVAQPTFPSSVTTNRNAVPITAAPGAFPYTVYTGLPAGYTYSIVSGDWMGNFSISGTSVVMNNVNGISFSGYSPETLTIEANDGYSSTTFNLAVPIGNAWYESDAAYVWDSVGATAATTMVSPSNQPFASFGGSLTEVTGTGNPVITSSSGTVSNDLWKMAGRVFANGNALPSNLPLWDVNSNPIPMLIAHLVDIGDQTTTAYQYEVGVGSGSSIISFGTPNNASATVWRVYLSNVQVAAPSDGTCPPKGTKAVHWCFIDPGNHQIVTGINQTVGATTSATIPSNASISREVRIGSNNQQTTSYSQMYHGSLEVLSRAGLTLAQAKTVVQNMQTHHGI